MRARVDDARGFEPPPDVEEPSAAAALLVGRVRAAHVGSFGPLEAEPAQVVEGGGHELGAAAIAVEILDSHHEARAGCALGGQGERACVAHVQEAGGRRSDAAAEWHVGGQAYSRT